MAITAQTVIDAVAILLHDTDNDRWSEDELLADLNDWQKFGRFVRLLSALTAQEAKQNQLGRELGITGQSAGR